ncbi:MAG: hypothetical protein ACP5O8_04185 [Candidatus Aenigmatarchaeota archaeon]
MHEHFETRRKSKRGKPREEKLSFVPSKIEVEGLPSYFMNNPRLQILASRQ